ncbi:PAS domain S-box protein [Halosegnis longus]|uniref:PAS domain S-box protein n=1 Tax=Halosegnis longus TaxID=2216012 RepID=A0AAJ4UW74_9EURY|nr:PAS domain S-box protein [Salella cibi]
MLRAITGGPNVTLVADETETIHFAGGGVEALFGYTPEELVGESVDLLVPAEFTDQHHAAMARYLDTGTRHLDWDGVGLVAQHRDGHTVPVDVSLSDTETESGRLLAATFRRQSSRESSERFDTHRAFSASVFENVNDAVVVATPTAKCSTRTRRRVTCSGATTPTSSTRPSSNCSATRTRSSGWRSRSRTATRPR